MESFVYALAAAAPPSVLSRHGLDAPGTAMFDALLPFPVA